MRIFIFTIHTARTGCSAFMNKPAFITINAGNARLSHVIYKYNPYHRSKECQTWFRDISLNILTLLTPQYYMGSGRFKSPVPLPVLSSNYLLSLRRDLATPSTFHSLMSIVQSAVIGRSKRVSCTVYLGQVTYIYWLLNSSGPVRTSGRGQLVAKLTPLAWRRFRPRLGFHFRVTSPSYWGKRYRVYSRELENTAFQLLNKHTRVYFSYS